MSQITLVSKDGSEQSLSREAADLSPVLRSMLSKPFIEEQQSKITLSEIKPDVLKKVVEYLEYCRQYQNVGEDEDVPEFEVPTEMSLELLLVADFLNI